MSEKKYCIRQGYVVREIAGEYLAVPIDSSNGAHIVILNPVSKFLWELMQSEIAFDELWKKILATYDGVSEKEASDDLKEFIEQLEQNGILK